MKKLIIAIAPAAAIAVLALAASPADASKACSRNEFKTKLVANACKKDQKAAKKAMRKFLKQAKKVSGQKVTCRSCHTKTSGDYPIKKDALKNFRDWGGK